MHRGNGLRCRGRGRDRNAAIAGGCRRSRSFPLQGAWAKVVEHLKRSASTAAAGRGPNINGTRFPYGYGSPFGHTDTPGVSPEPGSIHDQERKMKKPRTVKAQVDSSKCAGCGLCADSCVRGAITLDGVAIINRDICTGCGKCVDACPIGALSLK